MQYNVGQNSTVQCRTEQCSTMIIVSIMIFFLYILCNMDLVIAKVISQYCIGLPGFL